MEFRERDGLLFQRIYDHDGVLARRQIQEIFWRNKTSRVMEVRLQKLRKAGFIDWPSREHRRIKPIPEPIVWLGWMGALYIAGLRGVHINISSEPNESQLRKLSADLRKEGIRWQREPRWIQLQHDIAINDIRLSVEKSIKAKPELFLEEWIPEGSFLSNPDLVEYQLPGKKGKSKLVTKNVQPDGYFVISNRSREIRGSPARTRFLVELDLSTHSNPRFGKEKAIPGVAYIMSKAYKERFGFNSGQWLIVTTGETRMQNLMRQVKRTVKDRASLFLFATLAQVLRNDPLVSPIWKKPGWDEPGSLITSVSFGVSADERK